MSDSGRVRICDFGLGSGSGFEMRPVCNFDTSFYWTWPVSCHGFVKWPAGQKKLDRADFDKVLCQFN